MAISTFSPRYVADKNGVIKLREVVKKVDFDKYYYDYEVKQVVKKVGEGEEDYIVIDKVVESKRDIREVINSQADAVGLQAMLERFEKTGDPSVLPSPVKATDDIFDTTQLPQDNAEYFQYIHALAEKFESLPVDLRKDMTAEDFIKQVTDKQVQDWLEAMKPVEKKVEVAKDE